MHVERHIQQGFSLSSLKSKEHCSSVFSQDSQNYQWELSMWLSTQHYSKAIYSANWNYENTTFLLRALHTYKKRHIQLLTL